MSIASGLGATLGFAQETAYGTFVAPTNWVTFEKEALKLKKNIVQSKALHGGLYDLASRRAYTTHTVDGTIDVDLYDRGLGKFWRQGLGSASAPVQSGTSGVYTTVFTPGDTTGQSMSVQVGRPNTAGAIEAFSYAGVKITDWTLNVTASQVGKLTVTVDGASESTSQAYAAPSYVASNMLHFAEAKLLIGGTVTTTGGSASVSGATALAVVKSCQIKHQLGMDTSRFFLGANGQKAEPLANAFRGITGQMDVEFENLTDVYQAFSADTPTALQLDFTGPVIGGGLNSSVQILIPEVYFEEGAPTVDGPQVLHTQVNFTGLDDGTNPPIQVTTVSLDATI